MIQENIPGGQRDGNGGGTNTAHPDGNGGSSGRVPFTSAAYYGSGNGGRACGSHLVPDPRPAPRVALQRPGSSGKVGQPRAVRSSKGIGGRGARHGLAAVAAALSRKRLTLLCIATVIASYFVVSSHWLVSPTPPPARFKREHVKLLSPLSTPVNNSSESEQLPREAKVEEGTGVVAAVERELARDNLPVTSTQPKPSPSAGAGKTWGHWGEAATTPGNASTTIRHSGSSNSGVELQHNSTDAVSGGQVNDDLPEDSKANAQWEGPKEGEPPLSSMQRFSSLGSGHGQRGVFYELRNVRMQKRTVWVYTDPATAKKVRPFKVQLSHVGSGHSVTVRHLAYGPGRPQPMHSCIKHYKRPVIVFQSPPRGNLFHYLLDGALAVFPTLDARQLLDNFQVLRENRTDTDQYLGLDKCSFREDSGSNGVVGLTWPPSPYEAAATWSPLLRHMLAEEQLVGRDVQEDQLLCFDRLLLGRSQHLDWTVPLVPGDQRQRKLKRFLWFAKQSAATDHSDQVHERQKAEALAADPAAQVEPLANCHKSLPRFLAGRPVFTLASRANASTRAVRNEEELLAHVSARYDVALKVITEFSGSAWQTLDLLQRTDVFVGMHSDVWTNAMFLRDEAAAVQLLPFGWEHAPGTRKPLIRGNHYQTVVEATGAAYFSWVNRIRENAFFRPEDFAGSAGVPFEPHPTPAMKLPTNRISSQAAHWLSQDTVLDMASLGPVLDAAFAAAGILLRPEVAAQQTEKPVVPAFVMKQ